MKNEDTAILGNDDDGRLFYMRGWNSDRNSPVICMDITPEED